MPKFNFYTMFRNGFKDMILVKNTMVYNDNKANYHISGSASIIFPQLFEFEIR